MVFVQFYECTPILTYADKQHQPSSNQKVLRLYLQKINYNIKYFYQLFPSKCFPLPQRFCHFQKHHRSLELEVAKFHCYSLLLSQNVLKFSAFYPDLYFRFGYYRIFLGGGGDDQNLLNGKGSINRRFVSIFFKVCVFCFLRTFRLIRVRPLYKRPDSLTSRKIFFISCILNDTKVIIVYTE